MDKTISNWLEEYGDDMYRWTYYKTSSKEVAEDLVQDTFVAAISNYDKFKEESTPKTWLFSILNNKISDYYKKNAKREITLDFDKKSTYFDNLANSVFDDKGSWNSLENNMEWGMETNLLDQEDFILAMEACMDGLPENWKKAVHYKYVNEKKSEEICQELEISKSNYWQVIHRAKLLLKQCLEMNYFKLA